MKYCFKCGAQLPDFATACSACGASVPQTQPNPQSAVLHSFEYPPDDFSIGTPKKKSKKGLWITIISLVVLAIVGTVLWFTCFSGGNVEFGMSFEDAQPAMESNDFFCLGHDFGANVSRSFYEGEIEELGARAIITLTFNEKDMLCEVGIEADCDISKAETYLEEKLNVSFEHYITDELLDYTDISERKSTYIAENDAYIVTVYENIDNDNEKSVDICIYSLDNMSKKDVKELKKSIEQDKKRLAEA